MADEDSRLPEGEGSDPADHVAENIFRIVIFKRGWFAAVPMTEEVERAGFVSPSDKVGDQEIPIAQGGGQAVDHDHRGTTPLADEAYFGTCGRRL